MSCWVTFTEASGEEGAVKMAWKSAEAGPNELAEAKAIASAQYRRLYQAWPEKLDAFTRDEAGAARPTFR